MYAADRPVYALTIYIHMYICDGYNIRGGPSSLRPNNIHTYVHTPYVMDIIYAADRPVYALTIYIHTYVNM
jgi:hypothetical protein